MCKLFVYNLMINRIELELLHSSHMIIEYCNRHKVCRECKLYISSGRYEGRCYSNILFSKFMTIKHFL